MIPDLEKTEQAPDHFLPPADDLAPSPVPASPEPATTTSHASLFGVAAWDNCKWLLGAGWLLGSAAWLALTLLRIHRFGLLLRHGVEAGDELQDEVRQLARRIGLVRCPLVLQVPGAVSPMVWGWGKWARLLLPFTLLKQLDAEQRSALLAHELAHLKRRDHWVRLLELAATGLYWWLPIVWWARRALREAEEECCDAWVVWVLPDAAKAYAVALVETVTFLGDARPAVPPVASGAGQFPILKRRLTMIMTGQVPRSLSRAGLLALLGLGLLVLPFLPTWAQADPAEPPPRKAVVEFELQDFKGKPPFQPEEIEKLRNEARRLVEEMEKLRDHSANVEKRLHEIHRRLAELGGTFEKRIFLFQDGKPVVPGKDKDVIIFKFGSGGPDFKAHLDKKLAEIHAAEKDLDELRKNLETIQQLLKGRDEAKAAVDGLNRVIRMKEAELKARRAEVEELKARPPFGVGVPVPPPPAARPDQPPPRPGQPPMPPAARPGGDTERRLQELEGRLNELLREMQKLRQDLSRPGPGRPVPPPPPPPPRQPER